ncbi:MAG: hypothetical protein NZ602_15180 [Thermoguttaceae bacterium]|nr:hypothetical protein [Thermoguttaceae bacterium]MDW8037454.1 hypothetical protein [Thermoguttaceae bacterium]
MNIYILLHLAGMHIFERYFPSQRQQMVAPNRGITKLSKEANGSFGEIAAFRKDPFHEQKELGFKTLS